MITVLALDVPKSTPTESPVSVMLASSTTYENPSSLIFTKSVRVAEIVDLFHGGQVNQNSSDGQRVQIACEDVHYLAVRLCGHGIDLDCRIAVSVAGIR
jgi:hypothetical protein